MHLIIHNDWNITSYKTVTIATRTLARISLIILHFIAFQGIWDYSDICCHGYHEKYVFLLDFHEFMNYVTIINVYH